MVNFVIIRLHSILLALHSTLLKNESVSTYLSNLFPNKSKDLTQIDIGLEMVVYRFDPGYII